MMAPVEGSGIWPAWMQIVLKRAFSFSFTVMERADGKAGSDIIVADNRVPAIRDWLTGTLAGRALLVGTFIKSATLAFAAVTGPLSALPAAIDTIGGLILLAGVSLVLYRLFVIVRRRMLWRVRRKLTLSYIFIGLVPAALIIVFFLLCGLLLFFNVSSYLVQSRLATLGDQARLLADTAALELQRRRARRRSPKRLRRRQAGASSRYPARRMPWCPLREHVQGRSGTDAGRPRPVGRRCVGPWTHTAPPSSIPGWIACGGYSGLVNFGAPGTQLAVRAVAFQDPSTAAYAVVVDIPLGADVARRLKDETGIDLGRVTAIGRNRRTRDCRAVGARRSRSDACSIGRASGSRFSITPTGRRGGRARRRWRSGRASRISTTASRRRRWPR